MGAQARYIRLNSIAFLDSALRGDDVEVVDRSRLLAWSTGLRT